MSDKKIADFLSDKKLLVVDPSAVCRNSVESTFKKAGLPAENSFGTKVFSDAKAYVEEQKPNIIVTEYKIESKTAFDLMLLQKETNRDPNNLFIILTSSSEESVVAEAAEGDVDAFVTKPFSPKQLFKYISKSVEQKVDPPPYMNHINQAKAFIANKLYDDAISELEKAKKEDPKPALACSYLGQAYMKKEKFDEAASEFDEGLRYNELHYKCLRGSFQALSALDKKSKAYSTGKRISANYPLTPSWMCEILQLAIFTSHFSDIEDYYERYKMMDRKTQMLKAVMAAALSAAGKYFAKTEQWPKAIKNLHAAIAVSSFNPKVITVAVSYLLQLKAEDRAKDLLRKFPPEKQGSAEYLCLEFKVNSATGLSDEEFVSQGTNLVKTGVADEEIYKMILEKAVELNKKMLIDTIVQRAVVNFPERKDFFLSYLN